MSEGPISVGELSRRIKEAVERPFQRVWVEGELGEVKISAGGHAYLSLKDDEGLIQCVIWAQTLRGLSQRPPPGSRVEIYGRLTLYPPRGAYQLEVQRLRLAGVGQLQLAFEALKQRLAAEGLFDPARKRPIPALPRAIGLLTSPTGAAVRDMEAVLDRRAPQIPIYLMPTLVQGRGAAEAIARGLDALAAHPDVEVILLARGGGSLEDLWAFNEEIVARAVARCPTPIISGVGHETDFTIADFVADLRAATPSEAAEKAAPARDALRFNLAALEDRAGRAMAAIITRERRRLDDLQRRAALDLGLDRLRLEINALSQRQARAIDGRLS
ncbi:exodeoxyribonuclease VII large subunit, partial [Myxococcota bacterium]|nr:exodeoxyribonuclease VII large subunit [Myxococcota bacterium]